MKALIPAAGVGMRLRPHTHTKPKPLVSVAGKPILGHILDSLRGCVDEVFIIVGYMKEKVIAFANRHYADDFRFEFVEQENRLGLGHAVWLGLRAMEAMGELEPVLITLGDEFFGMDYATMIERHGSLGATDATLGVKIVDKPSNYGIVELDEGMITGMIEKPAPGETDSNIAIAGVYIVENAPLLSICLTELIGSDAPPAGAEYQLTDALQMMVERGATLGSFMIERWYDCGRPEMLLHVNRVLLGQYGSALAGERENTVFIEPVIVEEGCEFCNSVIGPYVSVAAGTKINNSIIKNSIIGSESAISGMFLMASIIGDHVTLSGRGNRLNIGENTEIKM